ncbi:hypothetical protein M1328_04735 [Patescibacteria group bacterium]|nr:hypothetical protein [Patescibacteria group bacterium]
MKKILKRESSIKLVVFIVLLCVLYFMSYTVSFGQTVTATPSSTLSPSASDSSAIEQLKEKVANKVEQIRKENNRAIAGTVTDVSSASISITTADKTGYEIKLDDALTKYYQILGTTEKEIKLQDIKKGGYVIAEGVINDKTIAANAVYIDQPYLVDSGKISEVDKENYDIKVVTSDKTVYTLSIENYTKQEMVNIKTLAIERIGFSKIIQGDSIHFTAKITGNEKDNTYSVDKILIVPQEYFMK